MNNRWYLGVEIGGTKIQVVLGNERGKFVECRKFEVDRKKGAEGIKRSIAKAVEEFSARHRISAIGIGFGGPVDWRTGKVACSHQVKGWSDFHLARWAEKLAGAPAAVENDANTAALAEATLGAGKGLRAVFYVTLGSGVGGGLAVDGTIYHGAMPGEAEIGHVRLDKAGTIVEERCSGWAVDRRIRAEIQSAPGSKLAVLAGGERGGEARHLAAALKARDPLANRILQETAEDLAFGLSHVAHLIHPQAIVLGGGFSQLGEPLRRAVARQLRRFLMDVFKPGPDIRIAKLGERVVPAGALLLARNAEAAAGGKRSRTSGRPGIAI